MKNWLKISGFIVFCSVLLVASYLNGHWGKVDASTPIGGEYFATSTRNSTGNPMASSTLLSNFCGSSAGNGKKSGTLGSFVITGAGAAAVTFYDATTSNANLRTITATSSLKVIASFPASTAAGTYVIDGQFYNGLLYDVSGNSSQVPTSTITCR